MRQRAQRAEERPRADALPREEQGLVGARQLELGPVKPVRVLPAQ